ncbi:TPA: hypothetical protein ACF3R9_005657 [Serratia marcescens]
MMVSAIAFSSSEVPIERGGLHAQMLRQATGAQGVDADVIQ